MTLLIISFLAGVLTVLAPCILPLLPVIVGGSLTGEGGTSLRRALVVVASLGLSVILFTLLLKVSTIFIMVPEHAWRWISGGIIIVLGFQAFFPDLFSKLGEPFRLTALINRKSNELLATGYKKKSVWGDVIIGAALGPVFSTCSPTYFIILATVLPESLPTALVYLFAYTIGLCLMLLLIALIGQRIVNKLGVAADPSGWIKRGVGALFVIVGIAVLGGYDKTLQIKILDAGFFDVTKIEQKLLQTNSMDEASSARQAPSGMVLLNDVQKQSLLKPAIEISSPDGFINTHSTSGGQAGPITIGEFKGKKVVLLDIWTYSCINCQRTIPYLNQWHKKYESEGLVIIGLHTPEFAFEEVLSNVEAAVERLGIKHPVVLDNDYSTWNAYGNQFWPRKYLIDIDGYIVYDHIGEGAYEETERAIQKALMERQVRLGETMDVPTDISLPAEAGKIERGNVGSPEIYFGASRNDALGNGTAGKRGVQNFTEPKNISPNTLYLAGQWNIQDEYAENSGAGSKIIFKYHAKNVYMVGSSEAGAEIEIFVDGKSPGTLSIKADQLYDIVKGTTSGEHTLEVRMLKGKLKAFTFTFG